MKKIATSLLTLLTASIAVAGEPSQNLTAANQTEYLLMTCRGEYQGQILRADLIGPVPTRMINKVVIRLGNQFRETIPSLTGIASSLVVPRVITEPMPNSVNENGKFPRFEFASPSAATSEGRISVKREAVFGTDSVKVECRGFAPR